MFHLGLETQYCMKDSCFEYGQHGYDPQQPKFSLQVL